MSLVTPQNKSFLLQTLCESNYRKLLLLIPNLNDLGKNSTGRAKGKPDLYLTILEKGPYTVTLELSHCFGHELEPFLEPALKLRVYFDAQSVEVLQDHERKKVHHAFNKPASPKKVMNYKWELNYFLEKWLNHCLKHHYQFQDSEPLENRFPALS